VPWRDSHKRSLALVPRRFSMGGAFRLTTCSDVKIAQHFPEWENM
jgi:hypothetical protein